MSELDKPPDVFERTDVPEQFTNLQDWKKFVPQVLKITIEAYRLLSQQPISRFSEDTFRINLVRSIKYFIHKHRIRDMKVETPKKLYTDEMMIGTETAKKAVELDICISLSDWLRCEDDFYFTWECKLVADTAVIANKAEREKHRRLVPEYITKGMVRFLDEHWQYSSKVDDAGILGFVLYGDVDKIVETINQAILNPPLLPKPSTSDLRHYWALHHAQTLSEADHLKICNPSPIEDFVLYHSHHHRDFCGRDIQLYHVFLVFNFD